MGSSDITNVYAALDRTHTVVALERSRRGDEGFRTFFDEFADYAANKGYIPYLLLLNFHIGDGSRLPPIEAKERGYRLAHLAPLEVKDIRQALMLYDLLYCRKHGLDPLAAQNTARNLCYKDAYAGFRNESIPALSQPGAPYRAVETEGGVALFRRGEQPADSAQRGSDATTHRAPARCCFLLANEYFPPLIRGEVGTAPAPRRLRACDVLPR